MLTRVLRFLRKRKKDAVEEKQLQLVLDYLVGNPELHVVDLGFNVGEIYRRVRAVGKNEYYAFEIQSDLVAKAAEIPDANLHVIHAAATDRDGEVAFYEPKSWAKNYKGGATIVETKGNLVDEPIMVPSIDFASWLERNTEGSQQYFLKIDIEGAEYDLLENLIHRKALRYVKGVAIEWHCSKLGPQNEAQYLARKNQIKLALWEWEVDYFEWF